MNRFEQLRFEGVTAEEARAYAEWLKPRKLPLRKKEWIPTPLPIVYLGPRGQVMRLPFLDLTRKEQVFGVAVDRVCYRATVLRCLYNIPMNVYSVGFLSVASKLEQLRQETYPLKQNIVTRVLASESIYARDFAIPTLGIMQKVYQVKELFDASLGILRDNGIETDPWGNGDFICQDDDDAKAFHCVVDFGEGLVKQYESPERSGKIMQARPMIIVKDYDPPYPIIDGVFDWTVWQECLSAYETK